jgi:hypothetical protein
LNLTIESITPFSVLVGSGERLPCSGIAKQVSLTIQSHCINVDFYVLPLKGWDMVLGVSWLATLGPVLTNYASSTFEFNLNGTTITWHGQATPSIHPIQFNGLRRLASINALDEFFHLTLLDDPDNSSPTCPTDLQPLPGVC